MKKLNIALLILIIILMSAPALKSFAPMGRSFGLGIMLGEPSGLTAKIWTQKNNAWTISVGNSYMGNLRVGVDYLFHFNSFNSNIVNLYAGPGVAVGFGESGGWLYSKNNQRWYKEGSDIGVGVRGVLGINIVPRNSPIEIFGEIGLMVGALPNTYANFEGSIGFRYYF